jgi:Astacin (Peptidase family M12A)
MSLGCIKNSATEGAIGTAVHEIGHALGLWHEQSRADRDDFVEIVFANISPDNAFNFRKVGWNGLLLGAYDFTSVMHYRKNTFSINGQDTIIAKNGASIIRSNTLSAGDVAGINQLYGTQMARVGNTTAFRTMLAGSSLTFTTTLNNTGALPIVVNNSSGANNWLSNVTLGAKEIASGSNTTLTLTFLPCSKPEIQSTSLRFTTSLGQTLEIPFLRLCFASVQLPLVSVSQISSNTLQIIWSEFSGAKSFGLAATADSAPVSLAQSQLTAKFAVTSARVQIVEATALSGKNMCFQLRAFDANLASNTPPLPAERCLIWK